MEQNNSINFRTGATPVVEGERPPCQLWVSWAMIQAPWTQGYNVDIYFGLLISKCKICQNTQA